MKYKAKDNKKANHNFRKQFEKRRLNAIRFDSIRKKLNLRWYNVFVKRNPDGKGALLVILLCSWIVVLAELRQ